MASDHDPKGAEASGKGAEPHIVTLSVIKGHAQKLPPGAHRLLNGKKKKKKRWKVWFWPQGKTIPLPWFSSLSYYVALAD